MTASAGNPGTEADEMCRPGRLWSLWDMLKVSAKHYIELGERIGDANIILGISDSEKEYDPSYKLSENDREEVREHLIKIWDVCNELGLAVSGDLISNRVSGPNATGAETAGEFSVLIDAVKAEIKTRLFLFVPKHKAEFYENDTVLGESARLAFPLASSELRSGGNAYAADLNTACVFYCMRALEHGLRALAADVNVTWDVQQWHILINEIEAAIKKEAQALPRGQQKSERLQFLSEAAKEFSYFKDGWRNYASHGKATYEEPQALLVMNHVRSFFETLSTHLQEKA